MLIDVSFDILDHIKCECSSSSFFSNVTADMLDFMKKPTLKFFFYFFSELIRRIRISFEFHLEIVMHIYKRYWGNYAYECNVTVYGFDRIYRLIETTAIEL